MVNSRTKGKRGELEARDMVRRLWYSPKCERSAQVSGKFSADLLYGPPGLHLEVKRHKRIAALHFMDQAIDDAGEGETPVVLMREDRSGWVCMFRIEDTDDFCLSLMKLAKNALP